MDYLSVAAGYLGRAVLIVRFKQCIAATQGPIHLITTLLEQEVDEIFYHQLKKTNYNDSLVLTLPHSSMFIKLPTSTRMSVLCVNKQHGISTCFT